ncbi:hypothetical protein GYH73_013355 [Bacillus megaterium]|nr:hypothetical protein [Priestia megaterium]
MFPNAELLNMSVDQQQHLLDWWNTTESAKSIVRRLVSLVSELRLHPESSHADGMILFYRAVSEVSYGYAGTRGCIRRAFNDEYSESLRRNMTMCHGFASKFSVDTKVLLERVAKQITGPNALELIHRIREVLKENDVMLHKMEIKAHAFYEKASH